MKMKTIINIWSPFGYFVYWLGWAGSVVIWKVSVLEGIGIGITAFIVWFVILNVFAKINGDGWFWEW